MKRFYCYCEESGMLCPTSRVYKVAIGDNDRDQIKKCLVDNYALDCGFYFRIWDDATEFDLSKRCCVKPRSGYPIGHPFQIIHLSIRDLYRHIIDGDLDSVRNPANSHRNLLRMASVLSPDFRANQLQNVIRNSARATHVKNLSDARGMDLTTAFVGFALIAFIFLLAGYLEGLERTVF